MGRAPLRHITRDAVVATSLRILDEGRDLGMRQLARELGVSAPTLYSHVSSRAELIELLRTSLESELEEPPAPDVIGRVRQHVRSTYRAFSAHPRLMPLLLDTPVQPSPVLAGYERLAADLRSAGVPMEDIRLVVDTVDALALGYALQHTTSDAIWSQATEGGALAESDSRWNGRADRADAAFELGLDVFIRGLALRLGGPG